MGLRLADEPVERRADRAVGVDGKHRAVDDAEGRGHRQASILIDEGLALLEGRLGVGIDDDPEGVALGARKFEQLEVAPMHGVEVAGGDGDTHGEKKGGGG